MIIRGTTPSMKFKLPFDSNFLKRGFAVIRQTNITIIEKRLEDCKCEENFLSVKLTQEESLKLVPGIDAEINLVMLTNAGDRIESNSFF